MQPPSGGCVLKQTLRHRLRFDEMQPPSGGCVLKHFMAYYCTKRIDAATFGWLCVETTYHRVKHDWSSSSHLRVAVCWNLDEFWKWLQGEAATFGWLCVETRTVMGNGLKAGAATFGWLCVETVHLLDVVRHRCAATFGWLCVETWAKNLLRWPWRAATFGWLCVETMQFNRTWFERRQQPPSGGCVLKHRRARWLCCGDIAATFGWLCVETISKLPFSFDTGAATFGWLCVETWQVQG